MSTTTDTPTTTTSTAGSPQTRPAPINGGIETYDGVSIPWTGGSRANPRTEPASTKAYRPSDFKSKRKTEEDCEEGLGTENRLKTPEELTKDTDAVLMTDWLAQLKVFMEKTGQDGVFYFTVKETEVNLLKNYGSITPSQVSAGVKAIREQNCPYDAQNLRMSAVAIRASLTNSMLQRIKAKVSLEASGPEVLAAVIAVHQVLDSSGCRILVDELRKMRLREFPAENVDEFNLKVLEKCRRIESCLDKPRDLASMVAECYLHTQSLHFNLKSADLYDRTTEGEDLAWTEVVSSLGAKYRILVSRGEWPAANTRKEDPKTLQSLQAMFNKFENKIDSKLKQNGFSGGNRGTGNGNGSETRTCHHCHQVGHIKPNCPQLKQVTQQQGAQKPDAFTKEKQTPTPGTLPGKKRYEAPGPNESHTKQLGQDTWKWCATCKRWNKGASAHLTDEHKSKNKARAPTPPKSAVGRLAVVETGLIQSSTGYLAKMGKKINADEIEWCEACNCWIHNHAQHSRTIAHNHNCGISVIQSSATNFQNALSGNDQAGRL
jgi:hypothetical protein